LLFSKKRLKYAQFFIFLANFREIFGEEVGYGIYVFVVSADDSQLSGHVHCGLYVFLHNRQHGLDER